MMRQSPKAAEIGHDDSGTVSIDVVSLLGDRRRRKVLECLVDNTQAIALADLAEDIADLEHEEGRTEISRETVQRVATSLYHVHIPQLVDAGVVEYDMDRDQIRPSDQADRIQRALSVVEAAAEQ